MQCQNDWYSLQNILIHVPKLNKLPRLKIIPTYGRIRYINSGKIIPEIILLKQINAPQDITANKNPKTKIKIYAGNWISFTITVVFAKDRAKRPMDKPTDESEVDVKNEYIENELKKYIKERFDIIC